VISKELRLALACFFVPVR